MTGLLISIYTYSSTRYFLYSKRDYVLPLSFHRHHLHHLFQLLNFKILHNTTTQLTRMFDFVDFLGSNSTTCPLWTPSTRPATVPAHCVCSGCCLFFPGCHSWHVHWHARFRSSVPSCAALFWRFSVPEEDGLKPTSVSGRRRT